MQASPFIIYGLPRSRTFWLSRFLTVNGWSCGHDEARHVRSLEDVKAWLTLSMTGTVETAAAPFWRLVQEFRPDIKTVVVRRPVDAVVRSLLRTGVEFDVPKLRMSMVRLDAKLDQIEARVPSVLSVTFDDLNEEAVCAQVFEHCLPFKHDAAWYAQVSPLNLQVNFPALMRYGVAYGKQMQIAALQAGQHTRSKLMAKRPIRSDGFVFAQEPLLTLLKDGADLLSQHLLMVGEMPDSVMSKNIPLLQQLEDLGVMHITTARQNGRMFGYLVSLKAPSLQAEGRTEAHHTSFYTAPEAPGLGLKLQRASVEFLREQGADEVFFRAGVRGSGPRMGALYRRLGAEEFGQMFRVDLGSVH